MFRVRSLIRRLFTPPEKGPEGAGPRMMPSPHGGMPQVMPEPAPRPSLSSLQEAQATPAARREQDRHGVNF